MRLRTPLLVAAFRLAPAWAKAAFESKSTTGNSGTRFTKVFDRFYRADRARARNSCGIGLGLAIVSQIVHLHSEDIEVAK
jgi:hypothetical protein